MNANINLPFGNYVIVTASRNEKLFSLKTKDGKRLLAALGAAQFG
jgi:hypothetical protein